MPRAKSLVWHFFTKDGNNVTCKTCGKCYIQPQGGTTTNMKQHIKVNHPKTFYEQFEGFASTSQHSDTGTNFKLAVGESDQDNEDSESDIEMLDISTTPLAQSSTQNSFCEENSSSQSAQSQIGKECAKLFKKPKVTQQRLDEMFVHKSSEHYPDGSNQEKKLTEAVAKFICKAALPFHLVEKPSFKEFLTVLEPR